MALFKFRKKGDETRAATGPGESIEAMRRRARHRLIGAVVLVLAGVIGFPLVFDTQPRPVDVDIPIEIPDRNKVRPLAPPPVAVTNEESAPAPAGAAPTAPAATAKLPDAAASAPAAAAPSAARTAAAPAAPAASAPAAQAAVTRPAEPAANKPEIVITESRQEAGLAKKPDESRQEASGAKKPDDAARALALLEGKNQSAAAEEGRFVVQVGAFAEQVKAREARLKLERAGIKTYTHVAETPAGRRIRVRAGPFPTRAEADRAAQKIKGLDLPAAILTL